MSDNADVMQTIITFINDELAADGTMVEGPDTPLLDGVVDSLGLMQIVGYIEDEFDVEIDNADITKTNFQTTQTICELIDSKLQGEASHAAS